MRLLNVHTLDLEYFPDVQQRPQYAVLSHTWGEASDEVLYSEISSGARNFREKRGFQKIQYTCDEARENGIDYAWVDTCCINKASSAELSEAINSMYQWYRDAAVCYAYIEDVISTDGFSAPRPVASGDRVTASSGLVNDCLKLHDDHSDHSIVAGSRWLTRGWTLQELVLSKRVKFYDREWIFIGSKEDLVGSLTKFTRIPTDALLHLRPLSSCSIAQRMSWASTRKPTRIEDIAYSLMGIFDVQMPLFYGEGTNAFIRLQKEIVAKSTDQSIFAWSGQPARGYDYLAESPASFVLTSSYRPLSRIAHNRLFARGPTLPSTTGASYRVGHRGLEINIGLVSWINPLAVYAVLDCFSGQQNHRRLAIRLYPFDHWCPDHATEFTADPKSIKALTTLDMTLSENAKVIQSVTILNTAPNRNLSLMDLRVRSFFDCEWSSMSSEAGCSSGTEELSFDMEECYPTSSWDSQSSTLTVQKSIQEANEEAATCTFAAKLGYTPRHRLALGKVPLEVRIVVHLRLSSDDDLQTAFSLQSELPSTGSTRDSSLSWNSLYATMSPLGIRQTKGSWNVELLLIDPSANDPLPTLAIAIKRSKSWSRHRIQTAGMLKLHKLVASAALLLLKQSRKNRKLLENSVENDLDTGPIEYQGSAAPRLTVEELYGSRKQWRELFAFGFTR